MGGSKRVDVRINQRSGGTAHRRRSRPGRVEPAGVRGRDGSGRRWRNARGRHRGRPGDVRSGDDGWEWFVPGGHRPPGLCGPLNPGSFDVEFAANLSGDALEAQKDLWRPFTEDGLDIARTYDAEAIHPPFNMIRGTPFYADPYYTERSDWADVDLLSVAHEEGRTVNVYTLTTWYQAEQLAAAGVDGLIADYPGLLRFGTR